VSLVAIASQFASAPEFVGQFGSLSNRLFVARLYENVFARQADAAGLAYWESVLNSGTGRGQLVAQFSESAEHVALRRRDVETTTSYLLALQRPPTTSDLAGHRSGSLLVSLRAILASAEFRRRFY
jgi:hypothetical protein